MPVAELSAERKKLSAFLADDEGPHVEFVAAKLTGVGIEIIAEKNALESVKDLEESADAQIIVLDLKFGTSTTESIEAAMWLKGQNPFRAIFFFTQVPEALNDIEWPVNFVLDKTKPAADQLDQIALRILIHDISLALLSKLTELPKTGNGQDAENKLLSFSDHLEEFYILLFPIEWSAEKVNPSIKQRCQQIRASLSPYVENTEYLTSAASYDGLAGLQRLFFESVSAELHELERIDGVSIGDRLKEQVALLKRQQSDLVLLDGATERKEVSYETSVHEEASSFQLSVWFPDRPAEEPWLLVGQESRMFVKLDFEQGKEGLAVPDPASADVEETPDTIEHIDVLILCPDADIVPLRNRIKVPPHRGTPAQFQVMPLREGKLPLTVVFMVQNDPIHRTPFYFEAKRAEAEMKGRQTMEVNQREQ
jgi:CheY-like chemotaxis protein